MIFPWFFPKKWKTRYFTYLCYRKAKFSIQISLLVRDKWIILLTFTMNHSSIRNLGFIFWRLCVVGSWNTMYHKIQIVKRKNVSAVISKHRLRYLILKHKMRQKNTLSYSRQFTSTTSETQCICTNACHMHTCIYLIYLIMFRSSILHLWKCHRCTCKFQTYGFWGIFIVSLGLCLILSTALI